jgi:hypothetical protein
MRECSSRLHVSTRRINVEVQGCSKIEARIQGRKTTNRQRAVTHPLLSKAVPGASTLECEATNRQAACSMSSADLFVA